MGRKPKTGAAKGKTTDPEQSARFMEAARQAGVDETGEALEEAFRRIARAPPPGDAGRRHDTARLGQKTKPSKNG